MWPTMFLGDCVADVYDTPLCTEDDYKFMTTGTFAKLTFCHSAEEAHLLDYLPDLCAHTSCMSCIPDVGRSKVATAIYTGSSAYRSCCAGNVIHGSRKLL